MKLNKPKFWDAKISFISILLLPISLLILLIIFLKQKFTKTIKFNIPIICIGNIYIGGTGKTPTAILLANELSKLKRNPVILRKFYKDHIDEHDLIKENFKNLILCKSRISGVNEAEKKKFDSVILDDGYQDDNIKKSLNIICFNQNQLIGNGLVLPAGPLRERFNSLKKANVILINGKKDSNFEKKIVSINKNIKIFYSYYKPSNIDQFKNKKLLAIAGIGNPDNFFKLIEENNLKIEKKLIFPDHHIFNESEVKNIINESLRKNLHIIMTEKDYFKIRNFNIDNINYLKVSLEIHEKQNFIKIINDIYNKTH
ncbi:tetraacyldisaccharide 4'-kinase [Pelagibacteraceae bacterium]|nr:tetraacyldisaccharide 4'-kinase [Pelagibacteraceae bacterium]